MLKYAAGPLLGPAMLAGAGRAAGHAVEIVDLNQLYIRSRLPVEGSATPSVLVGDHDKPGQELGRVQRSFLEQLRAVLGPTQPTMLGEEPLLSLTMAHPEVSAKARRLASEWAGGFVRRHLAELARPDLVGVSILYSGQVLLGLVVCIVVRDLWPGVPIVWGGPHVTALKPWIERDRAYGRLVDGFVFGYAEGTFVALLDSIDREAPWPEEIGRAGEGPVPFGRPDDGAIPLFDHLDRYGIPRLTLPVQTSRGCSYGRCAYCTYPSIEGASRQLSLDALDAVVEDAVRHGVVVSLKDSLVTPARLLDVADHIDGRVEWSACSKLSPRFDAPFVRRLVAGGCRTLEFGVETLSRSAQHLVSKRQPDVLLERVLDAATEAGLTLVLNYITGFPGQDERAELLLFDHLCLMVEARAPDLIAHVEHNRFQLERLSRMGREPRGYGIRVTASWPWASVLAWEGMEEHRAPTSQRQATPPDTHS
jgi:radical SAM superfamily enzyme YgiQ (UPF0313 family)